MISNIATYLFGSSDSCDTLDPILLTTVVTEDEWLLVDKAEPGQKPLAWPHEHAETNSLSSDGETSDCSLPDTLEGSWLYTPNSLYHYNSGATSEVEPEELHQPLENLLIEHPSMSVYAHGRPRFASIQVTAVETRPRRIKKLHPPTTVSPTSAPASMPYALRASIMQKSTMQKVKRKVPKGSSKKAFARQNVTATQRFTKGALNRVFQPSKLQ